MRERLKKLFWRLPISMNLKNRIRNMFPRNRDIIQDNKEIRLSHFTSEIYNSYIEQIINFPIYKSEKYQNYRENPRHNKDIKIIAYYLTQYHPTERNNLWWGKGTTEWTNVTKAVPQFIGHIQPKLPSDLGFYDLRLIENMREQIGIAKNYGINAFCFYYYWFNGERALEQPLNMFLNNSDLDIEFSICWCNEDWTKRYSGINSDVLLSVGKSEDSYRRFIKDVVSLFQDPRYIHIEGKPILTIYRPSQVPNSMKILEGWRNFIQEKMGKSLYIIASQEAGIDIDWTTKGFDAMSQFQPASTIGLGKTINDKISFIRPDFGGKVFDYSKLVGEQLYRKTYTNKKIFPAVMPAWDNTPRRNQNGVIYINSTPDLYKKWLKDAIRYTSMNKYTEDNLVFINAWNEWGEGAYMEPDKEYGYAYLQATYEALEEVRI